MWQNLPPPSATLSVLPTPLKRRAKRRAKNPSERCEGDRKCRQNLPPPSAALSVLPTPLKRRAKRRAKNPSERCEGEDFVVYLHRKTLLGGSDETPDKR